MAIPLGSPGPRTSGIKRRGQKLESFSSSTSTPRRSQRLQALRLSTRSIPQAHTVGTPTSGRPDDSTSARNQSLQAQKASTVQQCAKRKTRYSTKSRDLDVHQPDLKRRRISSAGSDSSEPQPLRFDPAAGKIAFWAEHATWPADSFTPTLRTWEELAEENMTEESRPYSEAPKLQYVEVGGFTVPKPIPGAAYSRRKRSNSASTGSSGSTSRDGKSSQYKDQRYETLLALKGSFLNSAKGGVSQSSKDLCNALLRSNHGAPSGTVFEDRIFEDTISDLRNRNEARVIQDIARLIVPSAETLAKLHDDRLKILIENVDETWLGAIPFEGPKPKPDYSVGFRRSAFSKEQLAKLDPLIGTVFDTSCYVATYQMYFPFLTCEVKCGKEALDIADRQNAHSMTLAVRGVIELFCIVGRHKELDREILAFSVSHDQRSVRIYGHYALVQGRDVSFYRHPIRDFSFTEQDGKEKWAAYQFTRNIYDTWMPTHLDRLGSAIEDLPAGLDFSVPNLPDVLSSQPDDSQASQASNHESQPSIVGSADATPNTSFTQSGKTPFKKPKKR